MLAVHQHPSSGGDINVLMTSIEGDREPQLFLAGPSSEGDTVFSPDGRYVAYVSDTTGQREIYIQPFPKPGPQTKVSVGGGVEPAWARNGELFYRRPDDYAMMAVPVATSPALTLGAPRELFRGSGFLGGALRTRGSPRARYAVTPDGKRFLMSASLLKSGDAASARQTILVVQNWIEELKRLVPTN
jgi:hypothetical protein